MTATPKDLQDEVGRLRDALNGAAIAMRTTLDRLVIGDWRRDLLLTELLKVRDVLAQTPPESADETQPQAGEDE